jgi:tetratricopeptide (TPR) repeat protein
VLAQGRALSFDQIADIIAQVADALDFAHSKGIVHRDVKPANVILVEGNRAKITDFGIAKIASGSANLTPPGPVLGTPNYMAPEQIKGAPVDGRTDLFSLGICLYECLTRRKPFGGDSLTSISYKIVHEPFPPLHEINPTIPDGFEEVAARCLAKDPAKRYQRGRDLAAALRAVARGERPRATDPVLEEETMVTRDRPGPMPTVEVPFPQALDASTPGLNTRPAGTSQTTVAPVVVPPPAVARPPQPPLSQQVRNTLTNVRAMPLWRRHVPPAVFFGLIAILVAGLIAAVAAIRSKNVETPAVDPKVWAQHARERQLRNEGQALLKQGRVTDAYPKFEELSRLAPNSPYVVSIMARLHAVRQRDELSKQQLAQAKTMYDEGVLLFNAKQYSAAIDKFQASFTINPSAIETGDYLKLAQQELQKEEAAKAAARAQRQQQRAAAATATQATTTTQAPVAPAVPAEPTQLTTTFTHPFTDGRIIVRAGGDVVANEQLFTVRKGNLIRRTTNIPKPVNVTHEFPAKNADVNIWVTVPAQNINEHHVLQFRFQPGSAHRLVVRYDAASKNFSYELN